MSARRLLLAARGGGSSWEIPVTDVRQYDTAATFLSGGTGFTPITNPGSTYFARVMASTPGLIHWWRLGKTFSSWGGISTDTPMWANSAGAVTLWSPNGATLAGSGLLTGDPDKAATLTTTQYLEGFDYFVKPGTHEVMTAECWVNITSAGVGTDSALMGEWQSNVGWMLHVGPSGALSLYGGSSHVDAPANLSLGTAHHVVGVIGGIQSPTPDYYSRLYVDGALVASGLLTSSSNIDTVASRFQINQYASGAGTGFAGTVDEVAVYSRMLQPDEITQHYQAGLGVVWP